ncbi:MAG: serine/threonine protein kinase [Aureliella sp.]
MKTQSPFDATVDLAPGAMDDGTVRDTKFSAPFEANQAKAQSLTGMTVGDYLLEKELARGGMGVVYKAKHRKLGRPAAVKMILGGRYSSGEDIRRFYVEAEAAAQLDHSGIIPIYDIGEQDGHPFFAMKYVEGGSLADRFEEVQADERSIVEFIAKAARAVHHAHQRGILHRDLKPANILLDENGSPVLTDLGLAKSTKSDSRITQTGAVIGTPSYMPPEQAEAGNSLTTAADTYSLGAVFYELLTSQPPHVGRTAMETVMRVMRDPVKPPREVNPEVNRDLELICLKALEHAPEDRYSSIAAFADDLERWLAGRPISVRPPSFWALFTQWARRNQSIGYAILALLAAGMFSIPLVFSILGSLENPASLYSNTVDDPRPWIYQFTELPAAVPMIAMPLIFAVLWPMTGLLVAGITRVESWWKAVVNGFAVGGVSAVLFFLVLGWMALAASTQEQSGASIELLAARIWEPNGWTGESFEEQIAEIIPGILDRPVAERAAYARNRTVADTMAIAPIVWGAMLFASAVIGAPIMIGTLIGHLLISRGQRWWLLVPRYYISWMIITVWILMVTSAFFGGNFNGSSFWELAWSIELAILFVPPILGFLVLRRWRRKRLPMEPELAS